jgi:hypothetical protein
LSFHKHRAILRKSHGDLEAHRSICNAWLETADEYGGNPGSLDALVSWLDRDGSPAPRWHRRLRNMRKNAASLVEDDQAPEGLRALAARIIERTQIWIEAP